MQAVHAAHEAGIRWGDSERIHSVVICEVPSEVALVSEAERLQRRGLDHYVFEEPDQGNQKTALATEPVEPQERRLFSRLPLWRG